MIACAACWATSCCCSMAWVCLSCRFCISSKNILFSWCSTTFIRASLKLGRVSSLSSKPSRIASPLAKATCMGPSSRCSGRSTRCSCSSWMAASACSSEPILMKAQPTPLTACEPMTNTSTTSPNSSKHSCKCFWVTSRGSRPTKSFTPPLSRSIMGLRSPGLLRDLSLRRPAWRRLADLLGTALLFRVHRLRDLTPVPGGRPGDSLPSRGRPPRLSEWLLLACR
mmetsp:Transcript_23307/g.51478  ORF Transcript_23307/g.51478 Transcript_23307/m.51478 type:complete len:225 (-) Transcript_23307:281-955(-)